MGFLGETLHCMPAWKIATGLFQKSGNRFFQIIFKTVLSIFVVYLELTSESFFFTPYKLQGWKDSHKLINISSSLFPLQFFLITSWPERTCWVDNLHAHVLLFMNTDKRQTEDVKGFYRQVIWLWQCASKPLTVFDFCLALQQHTAYLIY